jgi:hypothetical protein
LACRIFRKAQFTPPLGHLDPFKVHEDEDGHVLMMIKLNLEKKKEKNKNRLEAKV